MPVPMVDLTRDAELQNRVEEAVLRVVRSGQYVLGPEVEGFEREVAQYLGVRHVVGMSSGTDALLAALMALDIGPGDEVALPVYSFFATAGVVARLGARPVFVDVEPTFCNLDPDALERVLDRRKKVRAVIAVHLFGAPFDDRIVKTCRRRALALVEDAAQAIGTHGHGSSAGKFGLCACWSTFPTKNLGGIGDGGFFTTDSDELARKVLLLRNHGQAEQYRHHLVGGNFRLDALQAAALRVKLERIEEITETRRANAERYRSLFAEAGLDGWLQAPTDVPDRHAYHQFVVRMPPRERDAALTELRERNIGCAVYYPVPFHLQPCFAGLGQVKGDFPVAEGAAAGTLALPIFAGLTEAEQREVVEALAAARATGAS